MSSGSGITRDWLTGRRGTMIRLGWLTLTCLTVGLFITNIPHNFAVAAQVSPELAATLQRSKLPLLFPAYVRIIQQCVLVFGFVAVALLLFWRRSEDPVALFVGLLLVLTVFIYTGTYPSNAPLMYVVVGLIALGETTQVMFFLVFPDGQFRPSWMRWLIIPLFLFRYLIWLNIYVNHVPQGAIEVGIVVACILVGVRYQVYRYRHLSTPLERQQLKWFLIGVITTVVVVAIYIYVVNIAQIVSNNSHYFWSLILQSMRNLALLAVPITLAFSILRYRLWDIDLTINRSLVYSLISLILVGVFALAFFVTQRLLILLIGDGQSGIAIALAGLLCGALFNP